MSKKLRDTKPVKQVECDLPRSSSISLPDEVARDSNSDTPASQTIEILSSDSLDEGVDDVCDYLKKLQVCDDTPLNNSANKILPILPTPGKRPPKDRVLSSAKRLQELQSYFSSDDDYSPPPLSKRLWRDKSDVALSLPPDIEKKDIPPPSSECKAKDGTVPAYPEFLPEKDAETSSDDCDLSDQDEMIDSSGSDDFEQFLLQIKAPVNTRIRRSPNKNVEGTKIVSKADNAKESKSCSIPFKLPKTKIPTGSIGSTSVLSNRSSDLNSDLLDIRTKGKIISFSSDESGSDDIFSPKSNTPTPLKRSIKDTLTKKRSSSKASFLASLSATVHDSAADPQALIYRSQFKNKKDELVKKLFELFNYKVFNDKLPRDMKITWNPYLKTTAGRCRCRRDHSMPSGRTAWIELAPKVVDSADRVRDTLAHELCHAACWLVHGVHDGHGKLWKYWANRVQQMFPEVPSVSRCHRYEISTKYIYKCTGCGAKIGRHSKSIDTARKICGRCRSRFELFVNGKSAQAPSAPTGFALFVKQNYGNLKKNHVGVKHGDIMKMLSSEFSSKVQIST